MHKGSGFPKFLPAFGIIQLLHLQSDGCKMVSHSFKMQISDYVRLNITPIFVCPCGFPLPLYLG